MCAHNHNIVKNVLIFVEIKFLLGITIEGGVVMGIRKLKIGNNFTLYDERFAGIRNTSNHIIII